MGILEGEMGGLEAAAAAAEGGVEASEKAGDGGAGVTEGGEGVVRLRVLLPSKSQIAAC